MTESDALIAATVRPKQRLYCSFCGTTDNTTAVLIAGPGVYICGDCVALCSEILLAHMGQARGDAEYESWFPHLKTPNDQAERGAK